MGALTVEKYIDTYIQLDQYDASIEYSQLMIQVRADVTATDVDAKAFVLELEAAVDIYNQTTAGSLARWLKIYPLLRDSW